MAITLTIQPDSTTGIDTYIQSQNPTTNYKTATALVVGHPYDGTGHFDGLALISFPLAISKKSKILTATITIYCEGGYGAGPYNVPLYISRILESWTQTEATYQVRKTGVAWSAGNILGVSVQGDPRGQIANASKSGDLYINSWIWNGGAQSFTVTIPASWVQNLLDETIYGFVISGYTNGDPNADGRYVKITSCEGAIAANRPKLTITYEPYHEVFPISAGLGQVR